MSTVSHNAKKVTHENMSDENQQLKQKIATLTTTVYVLQNKERILTDLFEQHKAKYEQNQMHLNQKYDELKSQYVQTIHQMQVKIDDQRAKLKQKQTEISSECYAFSAGIIKHKNSIKLLENQINDRDSEINQLKQEISDLKIQLTATNKDLLQKDEKIYNLYQNLLSNQYYIHNSDRPFSAKTTNIALSSSNATTRKSSQCSQKSEFIEYETTCDELFGMENNTSIINASRLQSIINQRTITNILSPLISVISISHEYDDEMDNMDYDEDILPGLYDEHSTECVERILPYRNRSESAHVLRNSETDLSEDIDYKEMFGHKSI